MRVTVSNKHPMLMTLSFRSDAVDDPHVSQMTCQFVAAHNRLDESSYRAASLFHAHILGANRRQKFGLSSWQLRQINVIGQPDEGLIQVTSAIEYLSLADHVEGRWRSELPFAESSSRRSIWL